jgi:hypothetical protein
MFAWRRLADHLLAVGIALCGINYVQPCIQRVLEELLDPVGRGAFKADLRPAKTEDADPHVCLAHLPLFHVDPHASENEVRRMS